MASSDSPTRLVTYVIRHFLEKVGPLLEVVGDSFANTTAAVGALQAAFEKEAARPDPRKKGRPPGLTVKNLRHKQQQVRRLNKEVAKLNEDLALFRQSKKDGFVQPFWIVSVILAPTPKVGGGDLADSLRHFFGDDKSFVSEYTVRRILDTWHVFWKDMALEQVKALAEAAFKRPGAKAASGAQAALGAQAASGGQAASGAHAARGARAARGAQAATGAPAASGARADEGVRAAVLLHLQDAAAMRLRTVNKNRLAGLVRRQRSAKVQLHVLDFHTHSNHFEAPTDLEGLKDGTAETLATSLDRAYRRVVDEALALAARAAGGQVWLFHVLIGDGIPTNEAAAKYVWALAQLGAPGGGALLYFLVLIKCASHQASLVNATASVGKAAAVAATGAPAADAPRKNSPRTLCAYSNTWQRIISKSSCTPATFGCSARFAWSGRTRTTRGKGPRPRRWRHCTGRTCSRRTSCVY